MLDVGGLEEYSLPNFKLISNSPFFSYARFGDDPSHYTTIQTGRVLSVNGTFETIALARDTSGIHTLLPISAGEVCGSTIAAFGVSQFTYFPAFTPSQKSAYKYLSTQTSGSSSVTDIRSQYTDVAITPSTYLTNLGKAAYPANSSYTQQDFNFVQSQLELELAALVDAQTYYNTAQASTAAIFSDESTALLGITTALNLPADASTNGSQNSLLVNLSLQVVGAVTEFIGNSGIPVASQISELVSVVGDIISAVQQATAPPATSIASQTLVVTDQLAKWNTTVTTRERQRVHEDQQ